MKVVVVGLDGATWNLLRPLAEEGALPTVKRLMEMGTWGELRSTIPPSTFPAWRCYSTGKNPGKLGVFHFTSLDMKQKKLLIHTAADFKGKDIWDYLGDSNFRCGVINMPGTFPVKEINGFMVAGYPAESRDYTYPSSLFAELKRINYVLHPKTVSRTFYIKKKATVKDQFTSRFALAKKYLQDVDFLHLTVRDIDGVQHLIWNDSSLIKEYWVHLDKQLESLLDSLGKEANVFLMSDHGFTKLNNNFFLNNWLIKNGYLCIHKTGSYIWLSTLKRISRVASKLRLAFLFSLVPKGIRVKAANVKSPLSRIEWEKTKAVASGNIGIEKLYINSDSLINEREYMTLKRRLRKELEDIKDPVTQRKAMRVFEREQVYSGPYVHKAPDLMVIPESGYQIVGTLSDTGEIWGRCPNHREAFHNMHGIFLAHGPDIKKNVEVKNITIYDIAPTILHMFGLPVPDDMDGRVLTEIFKQDSYMNQREVKYKRVDSERDRLKSRVKKLKESAKI